MSAQLHANTDYTPAEQAAIKAFQAALTVGRYHKLYDAGSPLPRIISGTDPEPQPLSWLTGRFPDFCKENGYTYPAKPPSDFYLAMPLTAVTGTIFLPKGPAIYSRLRSQHRRVNTYQEFEPLHPAIELSPLFLDFFRRLFPVPEELHTFCQIIAHALRFPHLRTSWHSMLSSEQGTGKGFAFKEIITPLFAMQTKLVARFAAMTGQFGGTVFNRCMWLMLDDCVPGSASTQAQMKSLLSEERIYIEEKGKTGEMAEIYTRMILASNDDVPLPVEEQTRRWWIPQKLGYCNGLKGKAGREHRQAIIKALAEWLALPGAMEAVHAYFMAYSLDDFDPKNVPITATFNAMVAKSETPEEGAAADFVNHHDTRVMKLEELQAHFVQTRMGSINPAKAGELLKKCGMHMKILTTERYGRSRFWFPVTMWKSAAEAILDAPREG